MKERAALMALKEEDHHERGLPYDGEYYLWDNAWVAHVQSILYSLTDSNLANRLIYFSYYGRIHTERTLQLDGDVLKQYFPVAHVVPAVLQIYQDLLGVEFRECEGEVWHSGAFSWLLLLPFFQFVCPSVFLCVILLNRVTVVSIVFFVLSITSLSIFRTSE